MEKLKLMDIYYFINDQRQVESCYWNDLEIDNQRKEYGNFYLSKEQAEKALKLVLNLS